MRPLFLRGSRRGTARAVALAQFGALAGGVILVAGGALAVPAAAVPRPAKVMVGTFKIKPGRCNATGTHVTGSYFRLVFPNGSTTTGRFFENANSPCADRSYTMLTPGSQAGLKTGVFQPGPRRAFADNGDARATSIVRPVSFAGRDLSLSTNSVDPQTGKRTPRPFVALQGAALSGQVEALSLAWNRLYVNQGSPKPGGKSPGTTVPVSGLYNLKTHTFVLKWTSQIVGGSFNGFFGVWYLTGTFDGTVRQAGPSPSAQPTSTPTSTRGTLPPGGVKRNVKLINCGATTGGWSGGGVVSNPSARASTYTITVDFIEGSRVVAHGMTAVAVAARQTTLWSAVGDFTPRGHVRCALRGVTSSRPG